MGKRIVVLLRKGFLSLLGLLLLASLTPPVFSQEYPAKTITIVVGMGAGGIVDVASRVLADETKKTLGQDMFIENKPGASHMVAGSNVISSKPDGYTLWGSTDAPFIRVPHMMKLKYDPITETTPIIFYGIFTHFIVVPAEKSVESPFKNLRDMLAFAKANPGKLTFGNPGFGTVPHLSMAGMELETGLKISHIPFDGEPKEIAALLGGHLMAAGIAIESCISQVQAGKLRALGVLQGDDRLQAFPEIPTLKEVAKDFGMKTSVIYPGLMMDTVSIQLAAMRLAPVQLNSWGHPETSGMPTLDYYLSSDLMEPAEADAHYTERLVRLPNLSIYYEPVAVEPVAVTREELGFRPDAVVFWCGQSVYKYLPQYDHVFARIAKQVGNSQFAFLRHNGGPPVNELFDARLARAFAAEGLKAAGHCVFLPRLSQSKFVAAMGLADMFLDSIGWSGCNSTLESLPHDLPVITVAGTLMRGLHGAAILRMMGVTDTICGNVEDYIATAIRLAKNPHERAALSRRIGENKHRIYRDRACITALEDLIEGTVRR